ncbi:DUF4365 domain-containing protein [Streptomyces sp. NPDC050485]|uniref:DUF4365 domain-containing protein n=1 Tax=Streptomyces sp. NPDC050485 TaxID=3365617 RepID=UPI0037912173
MVKVANTEFTGRLGATVIQELFLDEFGWIPREILVSDIGADFYVEVLTEGHTTGRHLGVQAKSGPSMFTESSDDGWWFRFDDNHYQYWLHHDFPVIVVLVNLQIRRAYWQAVTTDTVTSTGEGWKIEVPASQVLDSGAQDSLAALADVPRAHGDSALAAFYDSLHRLPPEAVAPLARLHTQTARENLDARRPVERLAAALADGRHAPDACCAALLERTPRWLTGRTKDDPRWQGPVEHEVWCAIGGYANDHDRPARAGAAFRFAADAGAVPEGHWRAIGGIFEMTAGQPQAEQTLRAAREMDGGQVLADIALAVLAHQDKSGPVPIPASLAPQNIQAWGNSPTAHLFLGDQCAVRRDHDQALVHYEAALSRSPGSSTAQVLMAKMLLARLSTHKSPGRDRDLRRASRLAEAARADRRRWDGPSEVAAEVLLQARILQSDVDAALAVACPGPEGEATDREAASARLTAVGARIAYQAGQLEAGANLAAASTAATPLYAAELAAARADATGATDDERRRLWTEALTAAETDEQRFVAVQRLTQLGEWPIPALEDFRAADLIAPDVHAVMAAKAHERRGDLAEAARQLRPHQHSSVFAVTALADILEGDGKPHEAAAVLKQAAGRLSDLNLDLKSLDILHRAGDTEAAERQALLLLARPGLPRAMRLRLHYNLMRHANQAKDWATAGEHAENGLDEILQAEPDTDAAALVHHDTMALEFAWGKVGFLYNMRLWDKAWAAWDRYQPEPTNMQEALIWIHLLRRQPWTERNIGALLDLRAKFADDDEVSTQALDSVNRALAVANDPESAQWGALWSEELPPETLTDLRSLAARAMDDYQARHPNGGLTTVAGIPDAETLRALLTAAEVRTQAHHQICQAIRDGDAVLGLAASSIEGLYTQSLIQRAAGMLPACSTDPAVNEAECLAADQALDGTVVLDPSVLVITALLPGRWDALRAHFTTVQLPDVCMDDILRTEENIGRLLASSFTAGLAANDSTVETTTLTTAAKQHLSAQIGAVVSAASAVTLVPVTELTAVEAAFSGGDLPGPDVATLRLQVEGPWAAPLELALSKRLPLWSDDGFMRETARTAGIPAFGTVALTHTLVKQDRLPDAREDDNVRLLRAFVVDIPLEPDFALSQAEAEGWRTGSVAAALSRPAPWHRSDTLATWAQIASAVASHAPEQLAPWLFLASQGAGATGADAYKTLAQILTAGVTASGTATKSTAPLTAASAEAARVCGLNAGLWAAAVRDELASVVADSQSKHLSAADIEQIISQLIQGA